MKSKKGPGTIMNDEFLQGDIGLNVAQMIVELIRDNRKIVDRISKQQITEFIQLLRSYKVSPDSKLKDCHRIVLQNFRYLDLLAVLCVCDGVAIPDNQTFITDRLLAPHDQVSTFRS
jgi:inositol 1,4,5-triphosphate receptor type 1